MIKVVVFDGGYGGEFFADKLRDELPVVEVIRVIDWRNAEKILASPKSARKVAIQALRPYIGNVDLIILANHLLSLTSLNFFRRKFKNQKFLGFELKKPDTFIKRNVLVMTTRAVSKTISYRRFIFCIHRKTKTLTLDSWPAKIDDGELSEDEIKLTISKFLLKENFEPEEVILACSQFEDVKNEIKQILGQRLKIYDSFDDAFRQTCKLLRIRGGTGKKTT